jgi:hypothetical protein
MIKDIEKQLAKLYKEREKAHKELLRIDIELDKILQKLIGLLSDD